MHPQKSCLREFCEQNLLFLLSAYANLCVFGLAAPTPLRAKWSVFVFWQIHQYNRSFLLTACMPFYKAIFHHQFVGSDLTSYY